MLIMFIIFHKIFYAIPININLCNINSLSLKPLKINFKPIS